MLSGKEIYFEINGFEILKKVSLEVKPSTISCLIGPSGSGKSSIINCLSLLSLPKEGIVRMGNIIYFDDKNKENNLKLPYPDVTVVFQGLFLFPHLTNERNILLPLQELQKDTSRFDELIDKLKIRDILKKYPNECSGGERQRVALARQILLRPKYLLLDEVTSALDIETIQIVSSILLELKNKGMGILLATHMINLAKSIGDYFYFIDQGRIIETGDIQFLNTPKTERLKEFLHFS
ncbi:MAG: ATP-binding cassette domain-containing protein [Candidatus Paceibacterota bacterium]|jgi:ABC-type polar amino acid transport system ATPase subunit|nr:ATP-binding cassette domain-containing protein [Clostridia bacterium]MDD3092646.1 ATP-binding cassette domain-containing protein [Clostridia bacterium]MDD3971225.1 ATP-binding cassette domain-containing protein [Clostridia bacterium]